MSMDSSLKAPIQLTQTVQKGGCAAKVPALALRSILGRVTFPQVNSTEQSNENRFSLSPGYPRYLIDGASFDDASVISVSNDIALIQTIDFFTPIVDSPLRFGRIAAANALSDVYAMGGRPLTALGVLAYPTSSLSEETIADVLQGASEQLEKAGCTLSGGHSIDDDTLKFGLSVTGLVNPTQVWSNAGAQPGDHIILTKALGTGTITAGLKRRAYSETSECVMSAMESMELLNNAIDQIRDLPREDKMRLAEAVHAATDITGFGLAGHSMQLANASQVGVRINANQLPVLFGARESLRSGHLTKAHRTNREYTSEFISMAGKHEPEDELILFDPQTSGGLLMCIAPEASEQWLFCLNRRFPQAKIIGSVSHRAQQSEPAVCFEWN